MIRMMTQKAYDQWAEDDTAVTLRAEGGVLHGGENIVVDSIKAYNISSYHSNSMKSDNPNNGIQDITDGTSRTLDALNCGYPGCNQGGGVW